MFRFLKKKSDLVKRERFVVKDDGDTVRVEFGNVVVKMHYEDALWLSQAIRIRAKAAKRWSGDISRHWSVIGVLTDANQTRG